MNMGKTRKRSKFFKLFSCLNSKTGSIDDNFPDERSSPMSSPIKEIESSSPGRPTWLTAGKTGHARPPHDDADLPSSGDEKKKPTERVRHMYNSTGSIVVTWSRATSCASLRSVHHVTPHIHHVTSHISHVTNQAACSAMVMNCISTILVAPLWDLFWFDILISAAFCVSHINLPHEFFYHLSCLEINLNQTMASAKKRSEASINL